MFKQLIKPILFATVATFSIPNVVSAKPIPENATPNQIIFDTTAGIYTKKDTNIALKKEQPNVMATQAANQLATFEGVKKTALDKAYLYAKKAAAKNHDLGKFILGRIYLEGFKRKNGLDERESKREGAKLIIQACYGDLERTSALIPDVRGTVCM